MGDLHRELFMSGYENSEVRRRLAQELKLLRNAAGLSTTALAVPLGVNQSTVSRIERAQKRATIQEVDAWCDATRATRAKRQELLRLAEEVIVGPRTWSAAQDGGSGDLQHVTQSLEATTGLLSVYQPVSVPGLLQTPAYARHLLSSGPDGPPADLAERVLSRMERQRILYNEDKRIRFVIPEVALLWPYGAPDDPAVPDEHLEQLARIETATRRPNVDVGILPLGPLAFWRLGGFVIHDEIQGDGDPFVHLELLTRPYDVTEPSDVDMFRRTFDNLMGAAVTGDAARDLIRRVMEKWSTRDS
jgi:transcriptional regulator with XRE-family HTH domain